MKKYNKFILEKLNRRSLNQEDFINLMEKNCTKFLKYFKKNKNCKLIYRKSKDVGEFVYVYPKTSEGDRIAPYADHNYHNLLISNLESWKEWPKRNKSLIMSSKFRAKHHGRQELYVVIPYDNALIANCSSDDFWNSFKMLELEDISNISDYISTLISDVSFMMKIDMPSETNWEELVELLNNVKVDDKIKNNYFEKYNFHYNDDLTLLQNLNIFLEPHSNGFTKGDVKYTLKHYQNNKVESWTEDECLMIHDNSFHIIGKI